MFRRLLPTEGERKLQKAIERFWRDKIFDRIEDVYEYDIKKCRREGCDSLRKITEHRYCENCEEGFLHILRIISLVNGNKS